MTPSHRIVSGLLFASPCERPRAIPKGRPRGAKAAGLRYESRVAAAFPLCAHNPWFEFHDSAGHGWCSPDVVLHFDNAIVVLECKLTETQVAYSQLTQLYQPVLQRAYGKPVLGIVVCKHLTPETELKRVVTSADAALARAQFGEIPILHWLGRGPL